MKKIIRIISILLTLSLIGVSCDDTIDLDFERTEGIQIKSSQLLSNGTLREVLTSSSSSLNTVVVYTNESESFGRSFWTIPENLTPAVRESIVFRPILDVNGDQVTDNEGNPAVSGIVESFDPLEMEDGRILRDLDQVFLISSTGSETANITKLDVFFDNGEIEQREFSHTVRLNVVPVIETRYQVTNDAGELENRAESNREGNTELTINLPEVNTGNGRSVTITFADVSDIGVPADFDDRQRDEVLWVIQTDLDQTIEEYDFTVTNPTDRIRRTFSEPGRYFLKYFYRRVTPGADVVFTDDLVLNIVDPLATSPVSSEVVEDKINLFFAKQISTPFNATASDFSVETLGGQSVAVTNVELLAPDNQIIQITLDGEFVEDLALSYDPVFSGTDGGVAVPFDKVPVAAARNLYENGSFTDAPVGTVGVRPNGSTLFNAFPNFRSSNLPAFTASIGPEGIDGSNALIVSTTAATAGNFIGLFGDAQGANIQHIRTFEAGFEYVASAKIRFDGGTAPNFRLDIVTLPFGTGNAAGITEVDLVPVGGSLIDGEFTRVEARFTPKDILITGAAGVGYSSLRVLVNGAANNIKIDDIRVFKVNKAPELIN